MLRRSWIENQNVIPHFANVIKSVGPQEGVEITMNCNSEAFDWIIELVKLKSNFSEENNFEPKSEKQIKGLVIEKMMELNDENCLNKLVTSHFLQIHWIYEEIWKNYFQKNLPEVVNKCKISLSNLNPSITKHIAQRVTDVQLEAIKERKDKFQSNLYKMRIEQKLMKAGVITGLNSTSN